MEYCSGGSIKELLQKYGSFEEKLIQMYVKQIIIGLKYLHERKLIHNNLNVSNILVDGDGIVKISDFIVFNILSDNNADICYDLATNYNQGTNLNKAIRSPISVTA